MLFLLIVLLLIAAGFTMLTKRNRESLFLLGMCCSLMVQFTGILIFIAKKGGYSKNIISFLFFSQTLRINICSLRSIRSVISSPSGAISFRCSCWRALCNTP